MSSSGRTTAAIEGGLSTLELNPHRALLAQLPSELVDVVLTHVPPELLQRTAASLIQVFPDYPLSSRHLWTHVVVTKARQLMPLWKRLRQEQKKGLGIERGVQTFCQQSWQGDADILNKWVDSSRFVSLQRRLITSQRTALSAGAQSPYAQRWDQFCARTLGGDVRK